MDKTRSKALQWSGVVLLLAFAVLAWLMFAMRDGPLGVGTWIVAVALLLGGAGLILWSRKVRA